MIRYQTVTHGFRAVILADHQLAAAAVAHAFHLAGFILDVVAGTALGAHTAACHACFDRGILNQQVDDLIDLDTKLLKRFGLTPKEAAAGQLKPLVEQAGYGPLAAELAIGEPTLRDMVAELSKPGRDPRDELPPPLLRTDVMEMSDLKTGMELRGTVRNVTDFGAFVDIGVHRDGLVHISQFGRRVKHPSECVRVGDVVTVYVLEVDAQKNRISLSMCRPVKPAEGGKS